MVNSSKFSVDEDSLRYQARTKLADLAAEIAATRSLNKSSNKILEANKIRLWLKALDLKSYLTREQRERIWYALIQLSGVYDFPIAPVLGNTPRPSVLAGGIASGISWGSIVGNLADQGDLQAAISGKVNRSGDVMTGDLAFSASGINDTDNIQFNITPTTYTPAVGNMGWNDSEGTIDLLLRGGIVSLPLGQKQVARVVNGTGGNVLRSNYQVVKVTGAQGQRLQVNLAQANNDANSADTLGLIAENINNNNSGFIITSGLVENINTTGSLQGETWADGNVLYLSPTVPGRLTNVKPQAPDHTVICGFVVYVNANNGKIFVKIDNGYEIDELHNVRIDTGTLANGQILKYNSTLGVWENGTDSGITGTGTSGQVAYFNGTTSLTSESNLFWDATNDRLSIGTNTNVGHRLTIRSGAALSSFTSYTSNGVLIESAASGGSTLEFATGNASLATICFTDQDASANGFIEYAHSTDRLRIASKDFIRFDTGGTNERVRFFGNGNVAIGTTTDSGFKLDVNGTTRIQNTLTVSSGGALVTGLSSFTGTTASDGGQLGAELLSSSNWTSTGWTGDYTLGFTHTVGNTTALTNTLAAVNGTYYQIAYTVTNRTAGTFSILFGGVTTSGLSATGATGPRATSTGTLSITPTTDFDGTIVISIKVISTSSASISLRNSAGTVTNEIRNATSNTNTFIGINAGYRTTTGTGNSAYGLNSLANNTSGSSNVAIGRNALITNVIGSNNVAIGFNALENNVNALNNSAVGGSALNANTSGSGNSAFGLQASFSNTTGSNNSSFGLRALEANQGGGNNSAFGLQSLLNTTSSNNAAYGSTSLSNNTSGSNNSAFGVDAGRYAGSGTTANQTSSNSLYLGYQTRSSASGNTNEVVIGYNVVGLGSNTTVLGNSSTTITGIYGNLLLGSTTDGGQRLQVTGDTLLKGSGNTSATTALTVQNSDGTNALRVLNNGRVKLGNSSNGLIFYPSTTSYTVDLEGTNVAFYNYTTSQAATSGRYLFGGNTGTQTSGTQRFFFLDDIFSPTSGTATNETLRIVSTINQTGGANGITRGLYVNPTLTAAADWRSIEWSNNSGWGLYGVGSANNYIEGNIGVGSTSIATFTNYRSLDIKGKSSTAGGVILLGTSGGESVLRITGDSNPLIGTYTNTKFGIYTNSNERITIFANGNVAIGTTTDAGFKLDVNGTARIQGNLTTNLTAGSVPFIGTSGLLSQNNASLFWDNTNGRLGIGTNAPTVRTHIVYSDNIFLNGLYVQNTNTGTNAYTGIGLQDSAGSVLAGFQYVPNNFSNVLLRNTVLFASTAKSKLAFVANSGAIDNVAQDIYFATLGTKTNLYLYGSTGNLVLQNGGTFTDAGFRLDVNGTARIQNDLTISDTRNIILATTTGTKIGTATTQKLAFYGSTPVSQLTTAVSAATLVGGGGTALTDTDTFDGYTLKQIVAALRQLGLLA
jgi:hypothetical protein